ncbi:MAG: PP2C family protein-serine/threonine phosphatase [Saprospiraceae bacterium]|nr:PP2C family protein-serine/threonine phosphatase [Saprospiraceae bacterium]
MKRDLMILEKLEKELSLKQLQIKSLLTITQAINDNISAAGLFNMYKSFLSWEMAVHKMALYILKGDEWICASQINFKNEEYPDVASLLQKYRRLYTVKDQDPSPISQFDIVIPVFHKDTAIAYALIGGIKEQEDLYNKIQFITTITNIIAVAIENKRLFRETIAKEKLKREMELATGVQHLLIPDRLPQTENYQLDSIYMPHFNVGGDYFDFIPFDDKKFALCIADISGKGVSAALLMANFQAIIQSLIHQYRDLQTFVIALNQAVLRITKGERFITFVIAEIDLEKRKLNYVNCGHFPPIIANGSKLSKLDKGTSILGITDKLENVDEGVVELNKEALLFFFTDGLIDLRNEDGDYYSEEKIDTFIKKNRKKTAKDFNLQLMKELESFKGSEEYPDDIAILTCKIK